jgi:putative PEP-CTERM system integral membrane protein
MVSSSNPPVVSWDGLPTLPDDLSLAVVLDRSHSMAERKGEVGAALTRLSDRAGSTATIDVYLTASQYHGEGPMLINLPFLDPSAIRYAGGQNAAQLVVQFDQLRTDRDYDAIFVITDGSGYETGDGSVEVPRPDAPMWVVHLGDELPLGYDDATLAAVQASGGGVVGSIGDALTRLAASLGGESYDVVDGCVWSTIATEDAGLETAVDDDFAPLAARRLILAQMQRNRGEIDELDTLDELHDIAVEHSVVTPYSSMIVLVEERQEELLDELEARGDRFQREYEEVGETEAQSALAVTGVPEPEEWLLLGLAMAMLLGYAYRERLSPRRGMRVP